MNYEEKLFSYANYVMMDKKALGSIRIPDNITTDTFEISPSCFASSFARISELAGKGILIIITDSMEVTNLIISMFSGQNGKGIICPAIYCKNKWYADDVIKRINTLENTLVDGNGNEYIIKRELEEDSGLYVTDKGYIVVRKDILSIDVPSLKLKKKYKPDEVWGKMLPPDRFNSGNYSCRLSECTFGLPQAVSILRNIAGRLHSGISPQKIYVFGTDFLIADKSEPYREQDINVSYKATVFSVIFGMEKTENINDTYKIMTEYFIENQCPDYLMDFLEKEFCGAGNSTVDVWRNIFERYILEKNDLTVNNII